MVKKRKLSTPLRVAIGTVSCLAAAVAYVACLPQWGVWMDTVLFRPGRLSDDYPDCLSVSADGQWIAYSDDQDIYVKSITNKGRPDGRVAFSIPNAECASFSPDGRLLLFTSRSGDGSHLWTRDMQTGVQKQLTFGREYDTYPVYYLHGQRIAFTREHIGSFDHHVITIQADGRDEALVKSDLFTSSDGWRYSPEGILFSRARRGVDNHQIYRAVGSALTVEEVSEEQGYGPVQSADGQLIAASVPPYSQGIRVIDVKRKSSRLMLQGTAGKACLVFLPDNRTLLFREDVFGGTFISSVRVDGSHATRLFLLE